MSSKVIYLKKLIALCILKKVIVKAGIIYQYGIFGNSLTFQRVYITLPGAIIAKMLLRINPV